MIKKDTASQRDRLTGELRLRKKPSDLAEALDLLHAYLKAHRQRNTQEREFVLEKIYQLNGPADSTTLHNLIEMDGHHISLTTVYYAVETLIKAGLVRKVALASTSLTFYERTLGTSPHGYAVCRKCGLTTTLTRSLALEHLPDELPRTFRVDDVSFMVYGLCHKCQESERKAEQRERKRKEKAAFEAHRRRKLAAARQSRQRATTAPRQQEQQ